MQKNTPKQGCFCYFIPNLTPKQVWAQTFKSALTKTSPRFKIRAPFLAFSLKNSSFRPLNTIRVYVSYWKKTPFYVFFFVHACVHLYIWVAPWGPEKSYSTIFSDSLTASFKASGRGHSHWKGVWGCAVVMNPFFQAIRRSLAYQFTVN